MARQWALYLYLGVISLILVGIVSESLLIGPSLFASTSWGRVAHAVVGALLLLPTLLLPVAAWLSRLPQRMTILSVVLCVLALIEVTSASLGRKVPVLAALHPATALLMVSLTVLLLIQAWYLAREKSAEMKPR